MKIEDIDKKIKEMVNKGFGKNNLQKELELVLYEELYEIMASDNKKLEYIGIDLELRASYLLETIFEIFNKCLRDETIDEYDSNNIREVE